jgi:hypothetical protein
LITFHNIFLQQLPNLHYRYFLECNQEGGSDNSHPLDYILKNTDNGDWVIVGGKYYGPATKNGTSTKDRNIAHKPEGNDYWEYNATAGTFKLIEP